METIQAPTNCPSCSSLLEWSNDLLYCRSSSCISQKQKKVEHFAKTLKIKGLGPSAVSKLALTDIDEIYSLTEEDIALGLSSEKLAKKLYAEIKNSESAPLNVILSAFSIPLIGKTASDKLSKIITNITEINESSCKQAGLGPKATENLLEWLHKDFFCFYDGCLPFDFRFETPLHKEELGVVCISGKLKSFKTKASATTALQHKGYAVKSSLTKDVTILVNESGVESAKTTQARTSGVIIIENLLDLLGEQ